jgi:hypothetical protein
MGEVIVLREGELVDGHYLYFGETCEKRVLKFFAKGVIVTKVWSGNGLTPASKQIGF